MVFGVLMVFVSGAVGNGLSRWLKEQGCGSIELRYVALEDWYHKVGFCTFQRMWMGEKNL